MTGGEVNNEGGIGVGIIGEGIWVGVGPGQGTWSGVGTGQGSCEGLIGGVPGIGICEGEIFS